MHRVAVVVFPGSNCDADTLDAARAAGSDAYDVWHRDTDLRQADVVILPGGFSYGDYLRSGAIARFSPVMAAVAEHARAGGAVLGICNGFQILCEAGLLARRPDAQRPAALPVPPGAGAGRGDRHPVDPPATSEARSSCSPSPTATAGTSRTTAPRPSSRPRGASCGATSRDNPNGSTHDIAGVCNAGRNVVGIMPHPERRNAPVLGGTDGARVFLSLEAGHATQHAGGVRAVGGHHAGL